MSREEALLKLKEVLVLSQGETDAKIENATFETRLVDDLGFSSIAMLYTIVAIEEVFSISFEDASFGDFKTIGDVVDYILQRV